jgi:hypothetical protein
MEEHDTLMGGGLGGDPAPTDPPPAEPAPTDFVAPEWSNGFEVEQELLSDPSLKAIQDIPSLIKSYVHAQRKMGADKTVLPSKDSSNEEWLSLYHKLGLPTEFDNYGVQAPEEAVTSEDFVNDFSKLAYDNNLLPQQANAMLAFVNEQAKAQADRMQHESQTRLDESIAKIKEEWGDSFDENVHKAKLIVKEFGGEEFSNYLNETGLGNDPQLIKAFAKMGRAYFKEDNFQGKEKPAYAMAPAEASEKINNIMGDFDGPYYNAAHPDHSRIVNEVNKLHQILAAKTA